MFITSVEEATAGRHSAARRGVGAATGKPYHLLGRVGLRQVSIDVSSRSITPLNEGSARLETPT
jgi:hypothetical protein